VLPRPRLPRARNHRPGRRRPTNPRPAATSMRCSGSWRAISSHESTERSARPSGRRAHWQSSENRRTASRSPATSERPSLRSRADRSKVLKQLRARGISRKVKT
jgi:hypothetical protein